MAKSAEQKADSLNTGERKILIRSHLGQYIDSRHAIVVVSSDDEARISKIELPQMIRSGVSKVYVWDATRVISEKKSGGSGSFPDIRQLMLWFSKQKPSGIAPSEDISEANPAPEESVLFVMDAMYFMQETGSGNHSNAALTREIKNCMKKLVEQKKTVFMISNNSYIPPELKTSIPVFEYPLPDLDYLHGMVDKMCRCFATEEERKSNPGAAGLRLTVSQKDDIARMLLGMREPEAQSVLSLAVLRNIKKRSQNKDIPIEFDLETITKQKAIAARNNPAVELIMPEKTPGVASGKEVIGGSHAIVDWFLGQKELFSEEARSDGIDLPKGAVIFGLGGTGKDWVVENLAKEVGWPLIHADLGATKAPQLGASHKNFRDLLLFAEANAPCFLVLSEWEKMMAGAMNPGSAASDGGANQEMLATWLNWTQRRTAPVFIWGLTNDITGLSQASLRAGRWDRIWYMDLPGEEDRKEVFAVHLKRCGWNTNDFDLQELSLMTAGYTQAEIRLIVNEAVTQKFLKEGPRSQGFMLKQEHIKRAIPIVPSTAKMRGAELAAVREFAKNGGYPTANSSISIYAERKETSLLLEEITKIANPTPTPPKQNVTPSTPDIDS